MIFAGHVDNEASQEAHPFWYRFENSKGWLWFTFHSEADVPKACHCGNDFYPAPKDADQHAAGVIRDKPQTP